MPASSVRALLRPSPWTPEREARALQLYLAEGFTAAQVADALGEGLTRSAVIAKIRRLGRLKCAEAQVLDAAPASRPTRPPRRRERPTCRLPPLRPPLPLPPLREAAATGAPRPLAALSPGLCRWPIDDPGPGRMHLALFCAGPAADGRYCAAHRAIACGRQPRQDAGR
jgi:GcrA cell cycle regulator